MTIAGQFEKESMTRVVTAADLERAFSTNGAGEIVLRSIYWDRAALAWVFEDGSKGAFDNKQAVKLDGLNFSHYAFKEVVG